MKRQATTRLYENYKDYVPDVQHEILAITKENIAQITAKPQKVLTTLKGAGFVENEEGKIYKQIRRRIVKTEFPKELL